MTGYWTQHWAHWSTARNGRLLRVWSTGRAPGNNDDDEHDGSGGGDGGALGGDGGARGGDGGARGGDGGARGGDGGARDCDMVVHVTVIDWRWAVRILGPGVRPAGIN